jgi:hypothetical protein
MKTIPIEQLDVSLTEAIEQQDEHEAIRLTKGAGTVAWVVRVPEAMRDTEAGTVFSGEGPTGQVVLIVQAKHAGPSAGDGGARAPGLRGGPRNPDDRQ